MRLDYAFIEKLYESFDATEEDFHNPNVVKVVADSSGFALYFC